MAHHQCGQSKMAWLKLTEAREAIQKKFSGNLEMGNGGEGYWFDWLLARVLSSEAAQLIEDR